MRILLVGPRFFGYLDAISSEFRTRSDIYVETADDIHSQSIIWRLIYRLNLALLYKKKLLLHNRNLLTRIKITKISHVLFVNCEVYDGQLLDECEKIGVKVGVYFWDSVNNKSSFLSYIKNSKNIASFDFIDCLKYNLKYIPLFAEHIFMAQQESTNRPFDLCMVSTIHSNRASWAKELYRLGKYKGISIYIHPYFTSKVLFFVRHLFKFNGISLLWKIKTQPLEKKYIAKIFAQTKWVLDVHHHKQSGLTSRTFEALASGAKLLTTNPQVKKLPQKLADRAF